MKTADNNAFQKMEPNLQKAIETKDVNTLRLTICEALYTASFKLVHLKVAKLLTVLCGNHLSDNFDPKDVIDSVESHVMACLTQNEGWIFFFWLYFACIEVTFKTYNLVLCLLFGNSMYQSGTPDNPKRKSQSTEETMNKKLK